MVQQLIPDRNQPVVYPDSDGQPMAENTKQFRWIVTIKENLELLFADEPNVFIAGDLLWYPVEGNNLIRQAPDAMVVFGRPKGDRGSYQQWLENNIAPQVVLEILSPGNRFTEMLNKLRFDERYGVEECYIYDPEGAQLSGYLRSGEELREIEPIAGWVSPRLGVRFELSSEGLELYRPDGQKFATYVELDRQRELAEQRAEQEAQRAEQEAQRAERLAAKLQELGIDPDML